MLRSAERVMSSSYAFILVLVCMTYSSCKEIPSYITLCRRHDPNLKGCILNAVEQLRPHLRDGVPQLLLPPLNPLILPEAGLDNGDSFKASFKNIKIYHAHEFSINHLEFDLERPFLNLTLSFPKLRITSEYNINGRILILQLQGKGPADGNLTDVSGTITGNGVRYNKKGKEFLNVSVTKLDLKLGKPHFQFDHIFGDNDELNVQTNKIINENIVDILDELRPIIDKTVIEFASGIVGRIFNRFSLDELFPN